MDTNCCIGIKFFNHLTRLKPSDPHVHKFHVTGGPHSHDGMSFMPNKTQVAVCSAQGLTLEPGPNRFFDMERILSSHFGDASDADFVTSKEAPKLLQPHQSEASDASASVVVSQIPLCLFSCYWGEDKTPVVVGLQRVDDTISLAVAPSGRSNNNKKVAQTDVDESALMNKFGHIKVKFRRCSPLL